MRKRIFNSTRLLFRFAVVASFLTSVFTGSAIADLTFNDRIDIGKMALEEGDFENANRVLSRCLTELRKTEERELRYTCLFLLASVKQEQGKVAAKEAEKLALFQEAKEDYTECLSFRPNWGSVLNNLGQLYADLGEHEKAAEKFQLAIELEDINQELYKFNHANSLPRSKWKEAAAILLTIIQKQPWNNRVHQKLFGLYLENNRQELLTYLWYIIERGQIARAQKGALQALTAAAWTGQERDELLTIVAVCLSKGGYDPTTFGKSNTARNLAEIAETMALNQNYDQHYGINQILMLHEGREFQPSQYSWWQKRVIISQDAPRGMWPLEGFRQLIRSIGDRLQSNGTAEPAESYYLLAAKLNREDPDPEAYIKLADLHFHKDSLEVFDKLMREEEKLLFDRDIEIYRDSQKKRFYEFYQALGVIYNYADKWEDVWKPATALFHLRNAVRIADAYNQLVKPEERLTLEPQFLNVLGNAYYMAKDNASALEVYKRSQEASINMGDRVGRVEALSGMGDVYSAMRDSLNALKSYEESLKLNTKTGRKYNEAKILNNIGDIHKKNGAEKEAEKYYERSSKISSELDKVLLRQINGNDGTVMMLIPSGEFQMGNNIGNAPIHTVYLDAFYIDIYEVTNAQYKAFIDANPEWRKEQVEKEHSSYLNYWDGNDYPAGKEDYPVRCINWYAAQAYAQWAGKRLPTEAEWEKAARGGLMGRKYPWGDSISHNDANYDGTDGKDIWKHSSPVGSFAPNGYGLYDMAGNVLEWCADWFGEDYYLHSPRDNPRGPGSGEMRVLRGGWNFSTPDYLRCAKRTRFVPAAPFDNFGFRCVASARE